ncbi:peptidylprolyl isomerase [Biformimicrobium ophioploci]|uniref:Peptidyl-prolyl cis-trans isomerase n=1 Tax=Biformimicrobium ophioploci TaxID=3036711 RepID=A0ABQ6LZH4_9GAMM|nr:peptidylprolyl isomerase [Microbulbifer sp. NKW57]GMG87480.1 peptidylprolyl isomerase PpiA [Microbulbifer sp. NKW57]
MKKLLIGLAATLLASTALAEPVFVELKTDLGNVKLRLDKDKAPQTVENFLQYVDSGFYNGVIFHRVIPGFMAQGGGYTFDFQKKETREPVVNESANGLSNVRTSVAMARTNDPDSATAQFFINLVDNKRLDGSKDKPGYAVFGHVVEGMRVIDQLAKEPRGIYRMWPDAPNVPVRILEARRVESAEARNASNDTTQ